MSYIDRIFSKPAHLPTLAANVVELARLTQDEEAGARRVAQALGRDQTMSAKLLRLANAASYGSGGRVDSLEQAINLVGLTDFRVLVLASGALTATAKAPGLDLVEHWKHGHLTAQVASAINRSLRRPDGFVYLVGLLHTIGIPLMHLADPKQAIEIAEQSAGMNYWGRIQVEREILGTDHAEIGAELLRRWRLPEAISNLVQTYPDGPRAAHSSQSTVGVASVAAFALRRGTDIDTVWRQLQDTIKLEDVGPSLLEDCIRASEIESASNASELQKA